MPPRKDVMGMVLAKEMVLVDPARSVYVRDLKIRDLPRLSADTPMYDMLQLFETGRCVKTWPKGFVIVDKCICHEIGWNASSELILLR